MAVNERRRRQRKEYFPRVDPFIRFSRPEKFRKRFRITQECMRELAADFGNSQFATQGSPRGGGLSHESRVALAIRFLASGSVYSLVSDSQGVDNATVCRAVDSFVRYMHTVKGRYIKWPQPREFPQIAVQFHELHGMPRVIGAVDGTHVALRCPSRGDKTYYCRKKFHGLNVMAVCGPKKEFLFVNSRMPGSCHDAYVWNVSALGRKASDEGFGHYFLLGDSGYALRSYMMTPFRNPHLVAEEAYNKSHKSTRSLIERAFGELKQRFRCLDHSAGYLMSSPEKVSLIIMACACLHNIAIRSGQEMDLNEAEVERIIRDENEIPGEVAGEPQAAERNLYLEGVATRDRVLESHFSET